VLRVTVEIHLDPNAIQQLCDPNGKEGRNISGCHVKLGPNTSRLILPMPESWCDWDNMRTWGHELMHAFGFMHSKQYQVFTFTTHDRWVGKDCGYTEAYK